VTRFLPAFFVSFTALGAGACTESPDYLPPCVDPQVACPGLDAGADGDASEASASDGSKEKRDARSSDTGRDDR
jgi:hypothetical protein